MRVFNQIKIAGTLAVLVACVGMGWTQSQPCHCKDIGDLRRRIQIAKAAIKAYQNEIAVMRTQEAKEGKTLEFTQDRYGRLQFLIQESILQTQSWEGGSGATAKTNSACDIEIDSTATPCIRESLRVHETVHRKACLASKSVTDFATGKIDWKQKKTLIEVAQEEIDGYTAELAYLDAQVKLAEQDCCKQKQNGWTGIITFSRTSMKQSHRGPFKSPISATRTTEETTIERIDHYETIEITGVKSDLSDQTLVTADLEGSMTGRLAKERVADIMNREDDGCPDSLGGGIKNASARSLRREIETATKKGPARVHVSIRAGRYSLNFQTPSAVSTIVNESTSTTSGWCRPQDNDTKESSRSTPGRFAALGEHVEGSWGADPYTPNVLKGSKTRSDGIGGTITITWDLTHCH